MSNPQTYSMNTAALTPTSVTSASALSVTASSSIMTNYEASKSVDAQGGVQVIEDVNGNPIIFSIGTNQHLYAIVNTASAQTGWAQYDLTSAVTDSAPVEAFAVQALPNGMFAVVSDRAWPSE